MKINWRKVWNVEQARTLSDAAVSFFTSLEMSSHARCYVFSRNTPCHVVAGLFLILPNEWRRVARAQSSSEPGHLPVKTLNMILNSCRSNIRVSREHLPQYTHDCIMFPIFLIQLSLDLTTLHLTKSSTQLTFSIPIQSSHRCPCVHYLSIKN